MSIKAYDWFITDLGIWEVVDKIRDIVEPIFMSGMYDLTRLAAEFVAQDPDATWEDTPCGLLTGSPPVTNLSLIRAVSCCGFPLRYTGT
jgi:hypothetical protein